MEGNETIQLGARLNEQLAHRQVKKPDVSEFISSGKKIPRRREPNSADAVTTAHLALKISFDRQNFVVITTGI